ncbi:phosphoglyceromutase [Prauserella sp. PE36]|nr:phosphoglyceromutase [Prauserella sp. PE36]
MVLLRHGHSEGNLAGVFSGWLDVPLSPRGRVEAERAGRSLLEHGCAPAAVHSSVLDRSVATAEIVVGVLVDAGFPCPPIARTWRLNERHYGILQGYSRSEAIERFGESQVHRWRRSYREAPPPVSPDDPRHPATDPRYSNMARERLPGTESLADVLARLTEYWPAIAADLRANRTVLVVGHSNSLRALCVLLDGLGEEEVEELNLPTGVPLRYVLDADLRPRRPGGEFLDPDAARAGITEVLAQGRA